MFTELLILMMNKGMNNVERNIIARSLQSGMTTREKMHFITKYNMSPTERKIFTGHIFTKPDPADTEAIDQIEELFSNPENLEKIIDAILPSPPVKTPTKLPSPPVKPPTKLPTLPPSSSSSSSSSSSTPASPKTSPKTSPKGSPKGSPKTSPKTSPKASPKGKKTPITFPVDIETTTAGDGIAMDIINSCNDALKTEKSVIHNLKIIECIIDKISVDTLTTNPHYVRMYYAISALIQILIEIIVAMLGFENINDDVEKISFELGTEYADIKQYIDGCKKTIDHIIKNIENYINNSPKTIDEYITLVNATKGLTDGINFKDCETGLMFESKKVTIGESINKIAEFSYQDKENIAEMLIFTNNSEIFRIMLI
jgi:hypothetical protein